MNYVIKVTWPKVNVHYYLNYAEQQASLVYPHPNGRELLTNTAVQSGETQTIDRWGVLIIEEE